MLPFRVGYGFDLHRLVEGKKLIICGVDVPHTKGCDAHSDGEMWAAAAPGLFGSSLGAPCRRGPAGAAHCTLMGCNAPLGPMSQRRWC